MNQNAIIISSKRGRAQRRRGAKPTAKRQKKKTKTTRKKQVQSRQKFVLSQCADQYLRVLTNPFDPTISGACVPDLIDLPSKKLRVMGRTSFSIGTAGVGFASVSPQSFSVNNTSCVNTSLATFVGNTISDAGATVATNLMAQAPYGTGDLGIANGKVQFRIVGAGIRCRYISTELDRGGRLILFRAPTMAFDATGLTASDLLGFRTTITRPVTRSWSTVAWLPSRAGDYDFVTSQSTPDVVAPLIIMVDGATAGCAFEVEYIGHIEYLGQTDNTTRSHTDLPGMSVIKDAINSDDNVQEPGPSWYQRSLNWISTQGVLESSGPIIGRVAEGLLKQRVGL